MIGRKRSRHASKIASLGRLPSRARVEREVDHHDRVLLHDADQQDDADQRDDVNSVPKSSSASSAPTPADGSVERIVIGWM
jgi:hypothetical protein